MGCMSGLSDSDHERQRYGFTDEDSEFVDYVLVQGCVALGNEAGGYHVGAGSHDILAANM
ncbi:MAG: hypothetical protein FDZ70_09555 [Actinobacteria bacterium]|nr:MAG: hypothetical protein FDZ70_09555 [Actinomycetota bacterium]